MEHPPPENDSQIRAGGRIPGTQGISAFALNGPDPSRIPVLIAVPHAGRTYPGTLVRNMRNPGASALKLEDRFVDRLAEEVAARTGALLLVAHAPRAMIDLNRAPDDVDWEMFATEDRPASDAHGPNRRSRSGLGLIPRRLPGIGELWKRRHFRDELAARIDGIHAPYHACLAETLEDLRNRWGAAVLLDLHSMPPIGARLGQRSPEFVLGDRFGASCDGSLVAESFAYFSEIDRMAAHNRPYAGGYVLERHAAPQHGMHALQLEIDRSAYLDSAFERPGRDFADMAQMLAGLVRRLANAVIQLGGTGNATGWPEAAE
ncbi:MAG TPA: N-formylglutamate amidohydrolase [Novosphingobium sp.]|nr:N-formylglutamate amidohydrolase [Novosphingobium sp.]